MAYRAPNSRPGPSNAPDQRLDTIPVPQGQVIGRQPGSPSPNRMHVRRSQDLPIHEQLGRSWGEDGDIEGEHASPEGGKGNDGGKAKGNNSKVTHGMHYIEKDDTYAYQENT